MIETIAENLALPSFVVNNANTIYNDNKGSIDKYGYNKIEFKILEVASTYLACRLNNIPRTLSDFAIAGNFSRESISKMYRKLLLTDKYKVELQDPLIFLNRVASRLELKISTIKYVENIFSKKGEMCAMVGSDPMVRLASVIYLACVECLDDQTQKGVAEVCGCNHVSIRNGYMKLKKAMNMNKNTVVC